MKAMKKNQKKDIDFKKPFIVLSRKAIAVWVVVAFLVCAWMFVLGLMVGRGNAPLRFDINDSQVKLDQELLPQQQAPEVDGEQAGAIIEDETELDFYDKLPKDQQDTIIPQSQTPQIVSKKIVTETAAENQTKQSGRQETSAEKSQNEQPAKKAGDGTPEEKKTPKKPAETPQKTGDAKVEKTPSKGRYTIQAAAFKDPKDADRLVADLKKRGYPAYRAIGKIPNEGIWYRVRIGEYKSKSEAGATLAKLRKETLGTTRKRKRLWMEFEAQRVTFHFLFWYISVKN
jgi:cell division septation protein DedD